ncbi:MAG: bifunctional nuclease family protein [Bacillota bacterium]
MIDMKVNAVTVDQSGGFLVLLTDKEEKKVLPISVGPFEAQSIASFLQGKSFPRPLTHDLLKSLCEKLGGKLEQVVITDIRDSTFYAELYLRHHDRLIVVDSRPSDAIALALRCGATIFMHLRLVEFTYDCSDFIPGNTEDEEETH